MAKIAKDLVYIDTSAIISFLDRSDSFHHLFARLFSEPVPMITTPLVIAELHGWFLRKFNQAKALDVMNFLDQLPKLKIDKIGPAEIEEAQCMLTRFKDQKLTICDAVGLHLLEKRELNVCWSTDPHFALTGKEVIGLVP